MQGMSQEDKDDELRKACEKGDVAAIQPLIDSNANIEATNMVRRVSSLFV